MSEVAEPKADIKEISVIVSEILEEETQALLVDNKKEVSEEKKDEKIEEIPEKKDEIIQTFVQLFELFLTQDESKLVKFNLKLTPEIQKYFLVLCKESPELFGIFEETLKRIISDNRINTKDIPDILLLVSKVYNIIKTNKGVPIVDPYEVIKLLLHAVFAVYIETNKIENSLLLLELLKIIDSSIDLIKIIPIVPKKNGCFSNIFKC